VPEPLKPQWFQILFALASGPLHGSAVVEDVLERTDGSMKLWPATLYGSLRDLEEAGWIRACEPPDDAPAEGGRRAGRNDEPRASVLDGLGAAARVRDDRGYAACHRLDDGLRQPFAAQRRQHRHRAARDDRRRVAPVARFADTRGVAIARDRTIERGAIHAADE